MSAKKTHTCSHATKKNRQLSWNEIPHRLENPFDKQNISSKIITFSFKGTVEHVPLQMDRFVESEPAKEWNQSPLNDGVCKEFNANIEKKNVQNSGPNNSRDSSSYQKLSKYTFGILNISCVVQPGNRTIPVIIMWREHKRDVYTILDRCGFFMSATYLDEDTLSMHNAKKMSKFKKCVVFFSLALSLYSLKKNHPFSNINIWRVQYIIVSYKMCECVFLHRNVT